jgi:DNA mismatch repair protein MSH5
VANIGLCSSCAAINGIDPAIISRATEIASLSARGENLVAACAVLSPEETQALKEAVGFTGCVLRQATADSSLLGRMH